MPLYEYRCQSCTRVVEVLQKFSDKPLRTCAACGGRLEKLISSGGFILKGGGWYASGYGSAAADSKSEGKEDGAKAGTGEPKAKDEKSGEGKESKSSDAPASEGSSSAAKEPASPKRRAAGGATKRRKGE